MTTDPTREFEELLDEFADDLDLELDIDHEISVDRTARTERKEGLDVTEVEIIKPVLAGPEQPLVDRETTTLKDDTHYHVTVRHRKQCPSCDWVPQHDPETYEKPPELKGRCQECGELTCTNCHTKCATCDRPLCGGCSDGYGTEQQTLCYRHRQDVVSERQFEAKKQVWEQARKDEQMFHQHEMDLREYNLAERKHALEAEIQHNQQKIQLFESWSQHVDRVERRELDRRIHALNEEIERRKQNLREFETTATIELQRDKQEFEQEYKQEQLAQQDRRLDLQRLKHEDKMAFNERKQRFQEQIAAEKQDIQRVETLLRAATRLDGSHKQKIERKVATAAKKLAKNDQSWMTRSL